MSVAIAVMTDQYELPAIEASADIALSTTVVAANAAISGAIGGAINTGTLRGTLIGAGTAEAFWGVGVIGHESLGIPNGVPMDQWTTGQVVTMVAAQSAVGCVSSALGGGGCGSGAVAAGLGELTSGYAPKLSDNVMVQTAIVGLGGGLGAALAGGRFGDGFVIASEGYLFSNLAQDPNSRSQSADTSGGAAEEDLVITDDVPNSGPTWPIAGQEFGGQPIGQDIEWQPAGPNASVPSGDFQLAGTPNTGDPNSWYVNPGSGQMRFFGPDGTPALDIDFDHDHGVGIPHIHIWSPLPGGFPIRGGGLPMPDGF